MTINDNSIWVHIPTQQPHSCIYTSFFFQDNFRNTYNFECIVLFVLSISMTVLCVSEESLNLEKNKPLGKNMHVDSQ